MCNIFCKPSKRTKKNKTNRTGQDRDIKGEKATFEFDEKCGSLLVLVDDENWTLGLGWNVGTSERQCLRYVCTGCQRPNHKTY